MYDLFIPGILIGLLTGGAIGSVVTHVTNERAHKADLVRHNLMIKTNDHAGRQFYLCTTNWIPAKP